MGSDFRSNDPYVNFLMRDQIFVQHLHLFLRNPDSKHLNLLRNRVRTLSRRRSDEASTRFFLRDWRNCLHVTLHYHDVLYCTWEYFFELLSNVQKLWSHCTNLVLAESPPVFSHWDPLVRWIRSRLINYNIYWKFCSHVFNQMCVKCYINIPITEWQPGVLWLLYIRINMFTDIFSQESDSRIANVHPSVCLSIIKTPQPLRIMPISQISAY